MTTRLALVLVSMGVFSCGLEQTAEVTGQSDPGHAQTGAASALQSTEYRLTFKADGTIEQSRVFVAGGSIRVTYDLDRLPQCRGTVNGQPAWTLTGHAELADRTITTFQLGGFSSTGEPIPPAVVKVPIAGPVAFWFEVSNRWGCHAWDSNFGNNHRFEVKPRPTLTFNSNDTQTLIGTPGTWPTATVLYDLGRLPTCRLVVQGTPTWDIYAYWRFDQGRVFSQTVTQQVGSTRVRVPLTIDFPEGAKVFELWFHNADRSGCTRYDSNYGRNYRYDL